MESAMIRTPGCTLESSLIAIVLLIVSPLPAQSQQRGATHRITVQVVDSVGRPIDHALVTLADARMATPAQFKAESDAAGTCTIALPLSFVDVPLQLRVAREGYRVVERTKYWGYQQHIQVSLDPESGLQEHRLPGPSAIQVRVEPTQGDILQLIRASWDRGTAEPGDRPRSWIRYRLQYPPGTPASRPHPSSQWSSWSTNASGSVEFSDLIDEGEYVFTVEERSDSAAHRAKKYTGRFTIGWRDPDILLGDTEIDWSRVREMTGSSARASYLGTSYGREYQRWLDWSATRLHALKLDTPVEEILGRILSILPQDEFNSCMENALATGIPPQASALKAMISGEALHGLVRSGMPVFAKIFHDNVANQAVTMASLCKCAEKFFQTDTVAQPQSPKVAQISENPVTGVPAPAPAVQPTAPRIDSPQPVDKRPKAPRPGEHPSADKSNNRAPVPEGQSEQSFGNDGVSLSIGMSAFGPQAALGVQLGSIFIEGYGLYESFDWVKEESIWSKPTSGGYRAGLNVYPLYGASFLPSRFKVLLGAGFNRLNERLGKDFTSQPGGVSTGYWYWVDVHAGARVYILPWLSVTGWGGFVVKTQSDHAILTVDPQPGLSDKFSQFGYNLAISFEF